MVWFLIFIKNNEITVYGYVYRLSAPPFKVDTRYIFEKNGRVISIHVFILFL